MGISITSESVETLINRGLQLNLRSINRNITELFQRYSVALNSINGSELFGSVQTRQLQDANGISTEYAKGRIVFKNAIDKLQFLIDNRKKIASSLGITADEIYKNRRNLGAIDEYLAKLGKLYDLGEPGQTMQMYISKYDGNIGSLDSQKDWVDYILTQDWIDNLAYKVVSNVQLSEQEQILSDHRIEYLADFIQGMLKDHEIDYHKKLDTFNKDLFLDKPNYRKGKDGKANILEPIDGESRVIDAVNRLNSFGKLSYGFYEIFKPIGGTTEKYIKIKLSSSGELDITGVIGLSDCEHVEWEYGSMEYLRSLNTGNQRYRFKLSIPFNDTNSILWWKPDHEEPLEVDYSEEEEGEITQPTGNRYYKPYETERFLRWFGTNYVPVIDANSVTKKTICSIPVISNDVESSAFYNDATNITERNTDLTKINIDNATSISLLSLAQKATIDIIPILDEENPERSGQYLEFVVSGHQQTSNLSFRITGKMFNAIQEMNHFGNTWKLLTESYATIEKQMLFIEMTKTIYPSTSEIWAKMFPSEGFIPEFLVEMSKLLKGLQRPTTIDLLRFRQIDIEAIMGKCNSLFQRRMAFLENISGIDLNRTTEPEIAQKIQYFSENKSLDAHERDRIMNLISGQQYLNENTYDFIMDFPQSNAKDYALIPLADETKKTLIQDKLNEIYNIGETEEQIQKIEREMSKYQISFDQVDVDEIRDAITTYNNLIVRLPVDSYHNKMASRHIFLDWKNYVDKSLEALVNKGELHVKVGVTSTGIGTDKDEYGNQRVHEFTEYYVDAGLREPLIDYSHLYDTTKIDGPMNPYIDQETGKPVGDRWDYWTEEDFLKLD